jgi:hypothetical protein
LSKLTAVNIKPRRYRVPFGPIFLSRIAARKCKDFRALFLRFVPATRPSLPPCPNLSPFLPNASLPPSPLVAASGHRLLPDRAYAKAPPATSAPETTARVLLFTPRINKNQDSILFIEDLLWTVSEGENTELWS